MTWFDALLRYSGEIDVSLGDYRIRKQNGFHGPVVRIYADDEVVAEYDDNTFW